MWLAGGGVKPGITYGATDKFGYHVAEQPVHVHDFHATILHLLGIDHERLIFRSQGRDFRLTDVAGNVFSTRAKSCSVSSPSQRAAKLTPSSVRLGTSRPSCANRRVSAGRFHQLENLLRGQRPAKHCEITHPSLQIGEVITTAAEENLIDPRSMPRFEFTADLGLTPTVEEDTDAPAVSGEHDVMPPVGCDFGTPGEQLIPLIAVEKNQPTLIAVVSSDAQMISRCAARTGRTSREEIGRYRAV